jgi:cytochrome c peroxidase
MARALHSVTVEAQEMGQLDNATRTPGKTATQKRHWAMWASMVAAGTAVASGLAWPDLVRAGPSDAAGSMTHGHTATVPSAAASGPIPQRSDPNDSQLSTLELLGLRIFEDTALSNPPGQSCSSCHDPKRAFSGNAGSRIDAVAAGSRPGVFGSRNVPTIAYASFRPPFSFVRDVDEDGRPHDEPVGGFFWDGRADTLAEQAKGPLLNPREMNNASPAGVVEKVRHASYAPMFRSIFGSTSLDDDERAFQQVADALAAFESSRSFHPFSSKFDDYLRQEVQLDEKEALGLELFENPKKGNCIACHAGNPHSRDPADWLFTDFTFDALGLPRNGQIPDNSEPDAFDLGLCQRPRLADKAPSHFDISSVCGAFQVPSLRNVALTAPYGHNGVFANLREVVSFYATRDTNSERWYATSAKTTQPFDDLPLTYQANVNREEPPYDRKVGQAPRLNDEEIDALVAFLQTLTDR